MSFELNFPQARSSPMHCGLHSRHIKLQLPPGVRLKRQHLRQHRLSVTHAMYVPSDSFGGRSPEKKVSDILRTVFTFVAVKVILAQLEGSGRGSLGSYNSDAYEELMHFIEEYPMKDGDEWLGKLLQKNQLLAVRVMEVRAAYCQEDFEWDVCRRVASKDVQVANTELMRRFAEQRFALSLLQDGDIHSGRQS